MAKVTGMTKEKIEQILGSMIVGASVDNTGTLQLTSRSGTVTPGGNFNEAVDAVVDQAVAEQMAGTPINLGSVSGTVTSLQTKTERELVNSTVSLKATGNLTISKTNLPASLRSGTQFVLKIQQDSVGGRTLTLNNIKKNQGALTLSTPANSIDLLVFLYLDGDWYAGMMGMGFA